MSIRHVPRYQKQWLHEVTASERPGPRLDAADTRASYITVHKYSDINTMRGCLIYTIVCDDILYFVTRI